MYLFLYLTLFFSVFIPRLPFYLPLISQTSHHLCAATIGRRRKAGSLQPICESFFFFNHPFVSSSFVPSPHSQNPEFILEHVNCMNERSSYSLKQWGGAVFQEQNDPEGCQICNPTHRLGGVKLKSPGCGGWEAQSKAMTPLQRRHAGIGTLVCLPTRQHRTI